jgi:Putative outer membrane beta-barrel porin, MtrB/PioB
MKKTYIGLLQHFVVIVVLVMTSAPLLSAQAETPQSTVGESFRNHGEVTAGYRFTDVAGYEPQYLQLFYLKDGFRLFDFTLRGDSPDRSNPFADSYSLSASGLGGDPFSTAELQFGKTNLYDFRVQWRQSHYYRNQNDNVVLPITTAAPTLSTGLTDNHDWATVRKLGSASFTIHATNRLRFSFDFVRTTTNGPLLTTRSLDFFNAPSYWGSFARANPYPLDAPLHDETNRLAGGVDYSWRGWDFHYKAGFQSFDETVALNALSPGQVSINPVVLSTMEPLTQLSWSQVRRLNTPISEFSYRGRLSENLEWRGGYTYARHRGPATLDSFFSGIAPNAAGILTPYTVSEGGRANATEPNHDVSQGFTWRVRDWWSVNIDYRYLRQTSEATATVQSVFNGAPSFGSSDVIWRNGLSDLTFNMVFTPRAGLVLSPGIRLSKADIETLEDGVVDGARTLRTNYVRPEFRFSYRPLQKLSFRGELHSSTSGASYTAITPHTRLVGRLAARFELLPNLSIENDLTISSARLVDSGYHNRVRADTITISYALDDRFSAFGSMGYESFFADGDIVYARGTSPLRSTIRDQEIHRVWQAGIDVKPVRYVGLRVSANFDRLTGVGEILGEPPAYGPLTWPLATGTVYFEIPKAGRLLLDLQRTYYSEELVPANDFSANLLTVRFTRSF